MRQLRSWRRRRPSPAGPPRTACSAAPQHPPPCSLRGTARRMCGSRSGRRPAACGGALCRPLPAHTSHSPMGRGRSGGREGGQMQVSSVQAASCQGGSAPLWDRRHHPLAPPAQSQLDPAPYPPAASSSAGSTTRRVAPRPGVGRDKTCGSRGRSRRTAASLCPGSAIVREWKMCVCVCLGEWAVSRHSTSRLGGVPCPAADQRPGGPEGGACTPRALRAGSPRMARRQSPAHLCVADLAPHVLVPVLGGVLCAVGLHLTYGAGRGGGQQDDGSGGQPAHGGAPRAPATGQDAPPRLLSRGRGGQGMHACPAQATVARPHAPAAPAHLALRHSS